MFTKVQGTCQMLTNYEVHRVHCVELKRCLSCDSASLLFISLQLDVVKSAPKVEAYDVRMFS